MQCLVLAGGLGTRIKSIAGDTPKALLPVGSQTFIDWQLQWLKLMGVTDVVMALGHGGDVIQSHIEEKQTSPLYPQVNYSFDGPKLLGTGGAIKKAQGLLSKDFVIAYGDSFLFLNVKRLQESHAEAKKPLTFSIYKNKDEGDKSNVFWDGHRVKYDKFHPDKNMEYIDYGLSIVNKDYFLKNSPDEAFDLADFLSVTCEKNQAHAYEAQFIFQEIGSPDGYKKFCKMMEGSQFDLKTLAHAHSLL